MYEMDADVRTVLGRQVFTDLPDSLSDLADSLRLPNVHAIEIYDRGTVGLNGPFRASEFGTPNNFTSFVFDIGTTKSSAEAGGTFGFGKTASFEVSNAHSVVYWSRCRTADGEIEHRFIASSLHEPYVHEGARYTGAHWWGALEGDDDVVPIRGAAAQELGESVFRTHFGDADDGDPETGTSILIIDPVIAYSAEDDDDSRERVPVRSAEHAQALLQQVTDALAHSAWPKVVPWGEDDVPMLVGLYENRRDRDVQTTMLEQYRVFVSALAEVRGAQGQQQEEDVLPELDGVVRRKTLPIVLGRPRSSTSSVVSLFGANQRIVVGHLHLIESVRVPSEVAAAPADVLCLMRSETELVVRYDSVVETEESHLQWHGVFKPTPEFDRYFRDAEPPTHDRWTPESADDEASRYVVKKALEHLRTKTRAFLSESRAQEESTNHRSVRNVAMALRGFVPYGIDEPSVDDSPRRRSRRNPSTASESRTDIEIIDAQALPDGRGQMIELLPVAAEGRTIEVSASVYAITTDGRLPLGDDEVSIRWRVDGSDIGSGSRCEVRAGASVRLHLYTRSAAALEVGFESEVLT
ncbi:MAG: hypothetical protein ACTH8M_10190 [Microbacterium gubbeenense]